MTRVTRRLDVSVDMVYCDYAWTRNLYIQKTISYMFMVIDDST